jgi:hypothetical protein
MNCVSSAAFSLDHAPTVPQSMLINAFREARCAFRTSSAFRAWLIQKAANQAVGNAGNASCCPLCQFLLDVTRLTWNVGPMSASLVADNDRRLPLPEWAIRFSETLDRHHRGLVTAKDCLLILAEVA